MNELQERAYSALTKKNTVSQWRQELESQVSNMPLSEKLWPQEPQRECAVYDWPDIYAGQV